VKFESVFNLPRQLDINIRPQLMYTFPVYLSQHHSFEEKKKGGRMARDLRVKAVVRTPYEARRYTREGMSEHAHQGESSDEEWVDSASETTSSASTNTSQLKQGRSEGSTHPRHVLSDADEDQDVEVHAVPLDRWEFESRNDLDTYLAEYMRRTYQV
jgi:hypothetical protein